MTSWWFHFESWTLLSLPPLFQQSTDYEVMPHILTAENEFQNSFWWVHYDKSVFKPAFQAQIKMYTIAKDADDHDWQEYRLSGKEALLSKPRFYFNFIITAGKKHLK